MALESILKLEEAKQRLQQLEQDHGELLQLVANLKELQRTLSNRTRELENRGEVVEARLLRTRKLASRLQQTIVRLKSEGDEIVSRLEQSRQRIIDSFGELQSSLTASQAEAAQRQQQAVEDLARAQASEIAGMQESWTRERAELQGELAALREQTRTRFSELQAACKQELAAAITEYECQLHTRVSHAEHQVGSELSSVRRELRAQLDRRTYAVGAVIGVALFLAACIMAGRTSQSEAREPLSTAQTALKQTEQSSQPRVSATMPTAQRAVYDEDVFANSREEFSSARGRTWTDYLGRTVSAEFEGAHGNTVYLRRTDNGRIYAFPLNGLSGEDQALVKWLMR